MFTAGVPCFLANLAFASWLKFDTRATSWIITSVMLVATVVWANTQNTWAWYLLKSRDLEREKLRKERSMRHVPAGLPFDWHARPRPPYEAPISNADVSDISMLFGSPMQGGGGDGGDSGAGSSDVEAEAVTTGATAEPAPSESGTSPDDLSKPPV